MEGQIEKRGFPVTAADYNLLEEIGQGASAIVYRAICLPFNEIVAIKSLDLEKCNSNLDEICREAMTLSLISHPNVVKAHVSFMVEQNLWVVMPYMSGGSCLHIMKAAFPDGFDEPVIATVLRECLKALEYLHRHGHIHRDVKAGNILVDGNGVVKLGDFGVSACMFDTGDRQRSRNTFAGTPCWMAPEVMEQLHGYDFKADIWSFGITALELAHGHAPFSKYPPMKVLLMTLQNAPPGLDHDRDKRFSKSFKEMIAMCLVKDPAKRPTAEKLLRHSFFKHARTPDYIARHVLDGLAPLWERVKALKITDAARLAEKKMPFDEQEERSQTEYKRGVSSWNFNVEDLKAQAALIQDDDDSPPQTVKGDDELSKQLAQDGGDDAGDALPHVFSPSAELPSSDDSSADRFSGPVIIHSINAETANDLIVVQLCRGRFDVFEDDTDFESPGWHGSPKAEQWRGDDRDQVKREREEREHRKYDEREHRWSEDRDREEREHRKYDEREHRRLEDRDREESRRGGSGPLLPERVISKERSKAPVQKGPVLQKGRFSVTSDDGDLEYRVQGLQQQQQAAANLPLSSAAALTSASVPVVALMPHLQNALHLGIMQQEALMHILSGISPSDATNCESPQLCPCSLQQYAETEVLTDRERDLTQQVAELQARVAILMDELQTVKLKNVGLERKLNAIYNKEEEERIRKEEAAKEDG
ncbi:unnamed protein product [Sphagnum troendelagicum]|uniref:Protein kinase domain-containing protein n=1 Tax=Sphagnum troendelagicum TaxID=128251 RepID=A0ABP0UB88_9BRYO